MSVVRALHKSLTLHSISDEKNFNRKLKTQVKLNPGLAES